MADSKISSLTAYTTPLDADVLPVVDTVNAETKKTTWANIKATLKTYFDTLYGAGTVTTVSVTTANGVSGSVATATTTPAITLSLGAITPSSVQVSGLTASELTATDASKNLQSLSVATYPSLTELSYVKGVTSAIQTQINAKGTGDVTKVGTPVNNQVGVWTGDGTLEGDTALTFDTATDTLTTGTVNSTSLTASEMVITDGSKNLVSAAVATYPSLTELSYVKGLTSSAQTQISARLPLTGGTMTGSITLAENAGIALDPAGSADGKWTGITMTATAGATVSFGSLVYLDAATSRWKLADADASATAGPVMLAMCLGSSTDGNSVTLLLQGNIRADAQFPALTIGAPVYVGETAGAIQVAIPTGADNIIRVVGFALTADEIYFNPSQDHQVTVA